MSTRCLIGFLDTSGNYENWSVIYSYCHFDGYPAGVGKTLYEHYNTPELAKAISSLHGFRSLENTIEKTKEEEYEDSFGVMSYLDYKNTDSYGVDYVYLYRHDYWSVRPTFGYDITAIAENNTWKNY